MCSVKDRPLCDYVAMLFHAIFLQHMLCKPSFHCFFYKEGDVIVSVRYLTAAEAWTVSLHM